MLSMAQYVFTMSRVGKIVPPNKTILKDISLSFFPGAKIGVLGLNGAGKSTLLRIMSGVDKEFLGEARPQPDLKIGYLSQEPELDPEKDVYGNVMDGMREIQDLIETFNAISDKFADPMSDDEMNDLLQEQGELQLKIDAVEGWDVERRIEVAADALRLPAFEADVTKLSGGERRRVARERLAARGQLRRAPRRRGPARRVLRAGGRSPNPSGGRRRGRPASGLCDRR